MLRLTQIIKPALRPKLKTKGIPNFISILDRNKKLQAHIWDRKTYQVNPKTHVFTTIQERFGNRLINSLDLPPNAAVVDIGCFIGEKLWQLPQNKPYLGVGVDIAESSLKAARKIDSFGHKFLAADLEDLPFQNNSIDAVIVFDVIEHISHPDKGFKEISRILKPQGTFLLHIPIKDNTWSLFWWKQKLFPKLAQQDYTDVGHTSERMLTRTQIRNLLNKYDLELEKETPFNSFLVHLFDRELFKILASLLVFIFRSGKSQSQDTRTTHTGKLGALRSAYGKYFVPFLELLSFPDKIMGAFGIANTCFFLASKRQDQTQYYKANPNYSEFLDQGQPEHFKLYIDEIVSRVKPHQKVLDVGCGTGIVVNRLCQLGLHASGAEVSESSLNIARKKLGKYSLYAGKALPFPSKYFDLVCSYNVIEHVADINIFLSEACRVLKPGGILIIAAPNFLTITSSYHYRMAGLKNKIRNFLLTIHKYLKYKLGLPLVFHKIKPVTRHPFRPDDDAVNLVNPLDLMFWGKQNKLTLLRHTGAIYPGYFSYHVQEVPFLNLLTGGVFLIFRK